MGLASNGAGNHWLTGSPSETLGDMSIGLWVKPDYTNMLNFGRAIDATFSTQFWVGRNSSANSVRGGVKDGGANGPVLTATGGVWSHLLYTRVSSTGNVIGYLNGVNIANVNLGTGTFTWNVLRFFANNSNSPGGDRWSGGISYPAIWGSVLDATAADQLGNLRYVPTLVAAGSLLHYWRFASAPSAGGWTENDLVGSVHLTASASGPTTDDDPSGIVTSLGGGPQSLVDGGLINRGLIDAGLIAC